ncbi:MAG: TRAP transporter large permease subunit, partial [Verrucomicrobia bacterium]|nr:TRAP transporter large permease subunit [Verrucomicrobiota bacterium]
MDAEGDIRPAGPQTPARRFLRWFENSFSIICLAAMSLLPLVEIVTRKFFHWGVPGSQLIVQHLTLVIAFLGAALAARDGRLLRLATTSRLVGERTLRFTTIFADAVGAGVTAALCYGSWQFVQVERASGGLLVGDIPRWVVEAVMPVGLALVTLRLVWRASDKWWGRALAALGVVVAIVCYFLPDDIASRLSGPLLIVVLLGTALGTPIYALIGGAAMLLFWGQQTPVAAVPDATYQLTVSPMLPTIPLFTLAGYILAEGGTSQRLVRVFQAWFGWFPSGPAVVAALVCAFFTTFTGGSGVTILAVGGLLLPMLLKAKYPDRFSVGMLTTAGSLGLLFPPSLPVILYGIVSKVDIVNLFIAGFLPGCLMIAVCVAWAVRRGIVAGVARSPFVWREAREAFWEAKWEIALPV